MIDLNVDNCLGLNQVATITDSFTDRSIVCRWDYYRPIG